MPKSARERRAKRRAPSGRRIARTKSARPAKTKRTAARARSRKAAGGHRPTPRPPRKAPALERERRILREEPLVSTPPSTGPEPERPPETGSAMGEGQIDLAGTPGVKLEDSEPED